MNKVRETVVSIGAPVDKNVIWIDISGTEPIQKIFINGEWKPLKDSNVDAEFATGEKVSNLRIKKEGSSSIPNSYLMTQAATNSAINNAISHKATIAADDGMPTTEILGQNYAVIDLSTADNYHDEIEGVDTEIWGGQNKNITVINKFGVDVVKIIGTNTDVDYVTTIKFISSATPTAIEYNDTELKWANEDLPICEENAEYLIAIWKNIGIMTKVAPIPLV